MVLVSLLYLIGVRAMATATMNDFVFLCDARWDDPEAMNANNLERVEHVPVHIFRHRTTGQLHIIMFEDDRMVPAPTHIVQESELYGVPPGALNG
ncbi:MAG: hypothetical protein C0467_22700 [Planctomycetaceae bacterium]|nr:hypothetical protein [Planctomycetaceae bacterium]